MAQVESIAEKSTKRVTPEEFAELYGIHRNSVYRMCKAGKIAAAKVGQVWRIDLQKSADMLGV